VLLTLPRVCLRCSPWVPVGLLWESMRIAGSLAGSGDLGHLARILMGRPLQLWLLLAETSTKNPVPCIHGNHIVPSLSMYTTLVL
jgi:hypothetical protein